MLEPITATIGLVAAGASTAVGYFKSKDFTRRKLQFVDAAQTTAAPILAGVGAALVASPLVAILPFVGGGTALLFGLGVGAGVRAGQRKKLRGG
jgi:hypothetical protein